MASGIKSTKQIKIDKANQLVLIVAGVAGFLTIFSLVTTKSLLSYYGYQGRVISAKKTAVSNLKQDVTAANDLVDSYKAFVSTSQNILGGSTFGTGQNDGNNAKIILDALPSTYDFPGLASSIQNLFANQPYQLTGISGTDEQLTQQNPQTTLKPADVQIPIQLTATGSYQATLVGSKSFINRLQLSIRPFQVQSVSLTGTDTNLTVSVQAVTYYQPGVTFQIGKEGVQ